jgi:hypothetical protein
LYLITFRPHWPSSKVWGKPHRVSALDSVVLATWICARPPLETQKPVGAELAAKWANGQETQEVFKQSTPWNLVYQRDSTLWTRRHLGSLDSPLPDRSKTT